MVFDVIENAENYYSFGPLFQKGLEFLKNNDLMGMPLGKHFIIGDDLYANVKEYDTRIVDECEMETHLEYVDIHYILDGFEYIAYSDKSRMNNATFTRMKTEDIYFCEKEYNNKLFLEKGDFTIFFLNDAHMPHLKALIKTKVRKVIIKIRVEANEKAKLESKFINLK